MKPCIEPGCPNLSTGTRCQQHEAAHQATRNKTRTHYHGAWQRISRQARQHQPWCTNCGTTHDLTADHINPATLDHGVTVLCRSCNSSKGARKQGG